MAIQLEHYTIELYKENVKLEQLALAGEAEGSFAGCWVSKCEKWACRERKGALGREAKHGALRITAHSGTSSSSVCWGAGCQVAGDHTRGGSG